MYQSAIEQITEYLIITILNAVLKDNIAGTISSCDVVTVKQLRSTR